MHSDKLTGAWY